MHPRPAILCAWIACACGAGLHASEKTEFLAAFDPSSESIQLEFENQAEPGCFWGPYRVRDAIQRELASLGYATARSSLYVLGVVAWGAETDEHHCSVVLESEFRRYAVKAQVDTETTVSTDVVLWETCDLLTGPKIHMDDRIHDGAVAHLRALHRALGGSN